MVRKPAAIGAREDRPEALPSPVVGYLHPAVLNEWVETGVSWEDLVNHVIVQEVGHHFGLPDDEMHAIENGLP